MASQPQNFTADMRKAADPNHSIGGSTAVRGKAKTDGAGTASSATVQATGFMITGYSLSSPRSPLLDEAAPTPTPAQSLFSTDLLPLRPRTETWMLEGDERFDEEADADWRGCDQLGSLLRPR